VKRRKKNGDGRKEGGGCVNGDGNPEPNGRVEVKQPFRGDYKGLYEVRVKKKISREEGVTGLAEPDKAWGERGRKRHCVFTSSMLSLGRGEV